MSTTFDAGKHFDFFVCLFTTVIDSALEHILRSCEKMAWLSMASSLLFPDIFCLSSQFPSMFIQILATVHTHFILLGSYLKLVRWKVPESTCLFLVSLSPCNDLFVCEHPYWSCLKSNVINILLAGGNASVARRLLNPNTAVSQFWNGTLFIFTIRLPSSLINRKH